MVTTGISEELLELLRIPSVSADPLHAADVAEAARWVETFVKGSGGEAAVQDGTDGPLVIGEIPASAGVSNAPTVLLYGHVDVQPPEPLELWDTPPFQPTVRDGWLYCRGVADDKAQLWLLLEAARSLAREGSLPVNIRVLCDADEEVGGRSAPDWIAADGHGADAAIIFDTGMLAPGAPAINLGVRGTAYFHVIVRTGRRDVHSGVFGGAGLNATHALITVLNAVVAHDGVLPDALREGAEPPSEEELAAWRALPSGADVLHDQGVTPLDRNAAADFYLRTWAEPSLDVNGFEGGSPQMMKTIIVAQAEANLSMRLAPGQTVAAAHRGLERLLREATPEGASLELAMTSSCEPAAVSPSAPAISLAARAFEQVLGVRPVLVRSGGSLPIVPALVNRGIPTLITGFDVPDGNIHAPNERFLVSHLTEGVQTARAILTAYAGLR